MKAKRQAEILRLVGSRDIETQEQMLESLRSWQVIARNDRSRFSFVGSLRPGQVVARND